MCTAHRRAAKGALWHCSPSPLQQKTKLKHYLKNAGFIYMVISNVLHDLTFENKVKTLKS
jgi:SOS response regulatory protein OraA/RecX